MYFSCVFLHTLRVRGGFGNGAKSVLVTKNALAKSALATKNALSYRNQAAGRPHHTTPAWNVDQIPAVVVGSRGNKNTPFINEERGGWTCLQGGKGSPGEWIPLLKIRRYAEGSQSARLYTLHSPLQPVQIRPPPVSSAYTAMAPLEVLSTAWGVMLAWERGGGKGGREGCCTWSRSHCKWFLQILGHMNHYWFLNGDGWT